MGNSQPVDAIPGQHRNSYQMVALVTLQSALDRVTRESKEKSLLLTELRHRMKNNLQTVQSLLRLQRSRLHSSASKEELAHLEMHIAALSGVDGELLVADANRSVDLSKYLRRLMGKLKEAFVTDSYPVIFRLDLDGVEFSLHAASNIGLLVNEAVTNSFKHAVSKGTNEICLTLKQKDSYAVLTVSDNGPGFDGGGQKHLGGTLLMHRLAEKVRAVVNRDQEWHGTRYVARIPLSAGGPAAVT